MLENSFQNIFIIGSIISICVLPVLIYLSKYKNKYNPQSIYRIFLIISVLLFFPLFNFEIKNNVIKTDNVKTTPEEIVLAEPVNYNIQKVNNDIKEIINKDIEIKNDTIFEINLYMPYIWISIAMIMFSYYLIVYRIYIHKLKICHNEDKEIENLIKTIKNEFNVKRTIKYAFSSKITTPISIGIFSKKIIIPSENFDKKDYEYILKHEIFHVKNKDIECKFILLILNSLYWFNPIIYFLVNQIEQTIELNCDYNILEKEPDARRIEYGNILLNQIEVNRRNKYKLVMNFSSSRRNIMDRFSNIVNQAPKKKVVYISLIIMVLIIVSLLLMLFTPNVNIATTDEEKSNLINDTTNTLLVNDENTNENSELVENTNTVLVENKSEEKVDNDIKLEVINESGDNNAIVVEPEIQEEPRIVVDSDFIEPVSNGTITSRYGATSIPNYSEQVNHTGLDIAAISGTDIKAVASGKVIFAGWKGADGHFVIIEHSDLLQTSYGHCSKLNVKEGDTVKQGDVIAQVGSTGNSTGPHLHFEVRENGVAVNPQNYVYGE